MSESIIKGESVFEGFSLDSFCLRKGTPLLIPPPASGGIKGENNPANGRINGGDSPASGRIKGGINPANGRIKGGINSASGGIKGMNNPTSGGIKEENYPANGGIKGEMAPQAGRLRGAVNFARSKIKNGDYSINFQTKFIENIQPGEYVYGHDAKPHRVVKTFKRQYVGIMIGIVSEDNTTLWLTEDHLVLTERRVKQLSPSGSWSGVPIHHFERARKLRKEMTPPEKKLWYYLKNKRLGVKFRRQHPIGPYITDFYCRDCGLVVEVDGKQHYTPEAQEYDRYRDEYLTATGLDVLRFNTVDLRTNLKGVLAIIHYKTKQRVLNDDPNKQWRYAGELRLGEFIFSGLEQRPKKILRIIQERVSEDVYDIEVESVSSYLTEVCTVHNCDMRYLTTLSKNDNLNYPFN
ncbi:protein of unknown function DUF559 [Caldithrix abyssi DSM 13497]|uniref:Intein C-terminal splicing region/intein N-terminal splicing region n=1 Tax=Caldithrix abyssi DSM 13497 TaxID=880073 RepID=H1XSA4_CALAY|nr:DUF559 domain-containing protein [Caldithrix abyssi]APF20209.1 intein C-terminal splicing region/intein N-terminal splicing region [Caldithrix abyssi DSM 13497]EHO40268.1 protein of unknown function DUF559 [Caldithrix abyssi DSM 13497]